MAETIKKNFINKLLNFLIIDSFSKIGKGQVVENLEILNPGKVIRDL